MALAHYRLGRIAEEIETPAKALASYRQAEAMQQQLLAAEPNNLARLEALGDTLNAIGCALVKDRQLDAALAAYAAAVEIRKRLVDLAPQRGEFKRTLANTYMNIGLAEMGRDPGRGAKSMELAQAIRREALRVADRDPKLRRDLAMGCINLAELIGNRDFDVARQHLQPPRNVVR